jgi:hypothetical protein
MLLTKSSNPLNAESTTIIAKVPIPIPNIEMPEIMLIEFLLFLENR